MKKATKYFKTLVIYFLVTFPFWLPESIVYIEHRESIYNPIIYIWMYIASSALLGLAAYGIYSIISKIK